MTFPYQTGLRDIHSPNRMSFIILNVYLMHLKINKAQLCHDSHGSEWTRLEYIHITSHWKVGSAEQLKNQKSLLLRPLQGQWEQMKSSPWSVFHTSDRPCWELLSKPPLLLLLLLLRSQSQWGILCCDWHSAPRAAQGCSQAWQVASQSRDGRSTLHQDQCECTRHAFTGREDWGEMGEVLSVWVMRFKPNHTPVYY